MTYGLPEEVPLPPPPPVADDGNAVPAVAPLAPTVFPEAKLPTGPRVIVLFSVVDPLKVVAPEKVEVPVCVRVLPAPKDIVPLPVRFVVETDAKDPAPDELIWASAVPPLGTMIESNFPVLADTRPVEAPVKFIIPFVVSRPKTVL